MIWTGLTRLREPARLLRRAGSLGSITGKCEEKPMTGSSQPLPKADMQVKRLCKGKVPLLLRFFLQNGLTTTSMTIAISASIGNSFTARKKRELCGGRSAANSLRHRAKRW